MNTREQTILAVTVDQYIRTAEPVGSTALVENYKLDVSPATVRNSLNQLEKQGYLAHVHTSSGRVPTDRGYRLYVDSLMTHETLSDTEHEFLNSQLSLASESMMSVFSSISNVLSKLVDYTTMVLTPDIFQETLKLIQLISIDLDRVMVVLLHRFGVSKEILIDNVAPGLSQEELNALSLMLTEKLSGESINSISKITFSEIMDTLPKYHQLLAQLYEKITCIRDAHEAKQTLYLSGTANMLRLPEFKNIEFTQKVLSTLEQNKVLCRLLMNYASTRTSDVAIGEEHGVESLSGCSVVIAPIQVEGRAKATVGILGPKRMNYSSILPLLETISHQISDYLEKHNDGQVLK